MATESSNQNLTIVMDGGADINPEELKTLGLGAALHIVVDGGADIDPEGLDRLTRQLRDELIELDVEEVDLARDRNAPRGTKAAEVFTIGALAVGLLPVVVPQVITLLQAWLLREPNRAVQIKAQVGDRSIEVQYLSGQTSEKELKAVVDTLTGALRSTPGLAGGAW